MTKRISDLLNLGPASERMLASIGVTTPEQLHDLGAVAAYRLLKATRDDVSLNMLYAMHGALHNVRWDSLTADQRADLKDQAANIQFDG